MIEHDTVPRRGILPSVIVELGDKLEELCAFTSELDVVAWRYHPGDGLFLDFGDHSLVTRRGHRLVHFAGRWYDFTPSEYDKHFQETAPND